VKRIAILVVSSVVTCACGGGGNVAAPTTPRPDAVPAAEVEEQVQRTMNAFAAMDRPGFEAGLGEDVTAFETDLEGAPVLLASRAEVLGFADAVFGAMRSMGATMSIAFHATRCVGSGDVAYCTVSFDLTANTPDGAMTQPTRNTVVLRRGRQGWRWAHWHSSPATARAAETAAAAR